MKVLNLQCCHGHGFEGWFASEDDFLAQSDRGLIACPVCGDVAISKLPSAPRLHLSGGRASPSPSSLPSTADAPAEQNLQALWMRAVRHVLAHTEDVGDRFAEEARRIHYGESEERGIRGQATPQDAQALQEEGIEVVSLPIPPAAKEPLQ